MPDVRHILLLQITMHTLADADEAVFVAAGNPEQFQLLRRGLRDPAPVPRRAWYSERRKIRRPRRRYPDSRGRSSATDRRPSRSRRARGSRGLFFTEYFDSMNGMRSPSRSLSKLPKAGAVRHRIGAGAIVGLGAAIGHHDDHRLGFFVGDEVVQNDLRDGRRAPIHSRLRRCRAGDRARDTFVSEE